MTSYSLRQRLVGVLLLSLAIAWIGISALTFQDARREIDSVLDAHLEQAATLLADQADHELFEIGAEGLGELRPYGSVVAFQVWAADGKLLVRSTNAPLTRLSPQLLGFSDVKSGRQHWRVYSRRSAGDDVLVQIAETRQEREQLTRRFVLRSLWPLLIGLPLLGLLVWISVGRALRPLAELRTEVSHRGAADLRPLMPKWLPLEVAPLVEHLNALFERIRGTLDSERRFTSQAAHELRTPIAAIRAQAESALAAPNDAEFRHAIDKVITACDRLSRLVAQLLTLARMDEAPAAAAPVSDIDHIAAQVIADLAPDALEHGVEIGLSSGNPARISVDPVLVEVLIRNLVDNAIRYSGRGGRVDVSVTSDAAGITLAVADDGPGVSAQDLALLGRPFFRAAQPAGGGTGLGLSIVARIAERCRADISYERPASGRGLRAQVRFPFT